MSFLDPARRQAPTQGQLAVRAQGKQLVCAKCDCGAEVWRGRLRDARAQQDTTNALILQALRAHGRAEPECTLALADDPGITIAFAALTPRSV